jgi:hypothetical protein
MKMWDNPGGRHYFFNIVDHDTQYNRVKVFEITALEAATEATESPFRDESAQPNGVVSSMNDTITSFPLYARGSGGRYG